MLRHHHHHHTTMRRIGSAPTDGRGGAVSTGADRWGRAESVRCGDGRGNGRGDGGGGTAGRRASLEVFFLDILPRATLASLVCARSALRLEGAPAGDRGWGAVSTGAGRWGRAEVGHLGDGRGGNGGGGIAGFGGLRASLEVVMRDILPRATLASFVCARFGSATLCAARQEACVRQ